MNCEFAHERIVTAAYGELADEQTHELERHLAGCPDCAKEREQLLALKALADAHPVAEPAANLVARSRLRLEEALDALPPRRWYERLGQWMRNNFASMQAAPVAACLLLVVGAGAGVLGGYELAQNRRSDVQRRSGNAGTAPTGCLTAASTAPAEIANISSIVRAAEQPQGRSALQPAGAAADRGFAGRSGDSAVADAGQSRTRLRRVCGTTRWDCWRPSARPGTDARRRREFAMR